METLESYLNSEFIIQKQQVQALERTLGDVAELFAVVGGKDEGKLGWPYLVTTDQLSKDEPELEHPNSPGTTSMILSAVGVLTGNCELRSGSSSGLAELDGSELKLLWESAFRDICTKFMQDEKTIINSSTFGPNNILTVSQVCKLSEVLKFNEASFLTDRLKECLVGAVKNTFHRGVDEALEDINEKKYQKNAFILLCAMRSKKALVEKGIDCKIEASELKPFREFFESTLHDHLSFSSIPDSRFDPAELIYCLEGLLLCSKEAVDTTLLKRVLDVLSDKQSSNSHWRANKPFMTGNTGAIHLPLSVEGANSLMRSIEIMDEHRHFNTYTAMALPLISRFWTWLRARSVRAEVTGKACVGWHSEHVNTPDVIHLWDTAMVAEFMYSYREMLGRYMAEKSLHLAGLNIVRPPQKTKTSPEDIVNAWEKICEIFEPLKGVSVPKQPKVYNDAKIDFIEGWSKNEPTNFSILLYGPPGTGKSTFAENMAKALGFPFITVTVSDFLGSGGANVEARAKAVFKALEMQQGCVILFDEIDSFLLDRNSKRYSEQDSLFQFLTPGMLTKINDLRKLKRSIFIIATNYEKRIDPAIKRTGRIDKKYLLGLPDAARRAGMLRLEEDLQFNLRRKSVLFGFSDLDGAKRDAEKCTPTSLQDEIVKKLEGREPATSVKTYLDLSKKDEIFPEDELLGLLSLYKEAYGSDKVKALQHEPATTGDIPLLSEKVTGLLQELGYPHLNEESE